MSREFTTSHEIRIFGMMMLFALIASFFVASWKHAEPAMITAIITGGFVGEAWHRWRTRTLK